MAVSFIGGGNRSIRRGKVSLLKKKVFQFHKYCLRSEEIIICDIFFSDPPTVTVSLPNYATKEGTTVTLGCTVVASPAASRVWWTRVNSNGQNTNVDMNNQKYGGSSVSNPSLVIFNPSLADEGNYICYAENAIGQGQSTQTYLDVTGGNPFNFF